MFFFKRLNHWWSTLLFALWRLTLVVVVGSVVVVLSLRWLPPPTTSFVLQDKVRHLFTGKPKVVQYRWVRASRISPHMMLAVVASEDQRFPDHAGFDFQAISAAIEERFRKGRLRRGASTISQQVAKNLFLWRGRSMVRKGIEAYFTLLIETFWSKRRILEVYLNAAEFSPGVYGVKAASRRFFHKKPSQLTREEAALLAAVLPSPRRFRVERPSAYVRGRQTHILSQMRMLSQMGYKKMF